MVKAAGVAGVGAQRGGICALDRGCVANDFETGRIPKVRLHPGAKHVDQMGVPSPQSVIRSRIFFSLRYSMRHSKTITRRWSIPMFSLSKTPDLKIRVYEHNGNSVTITPSAAGLATIWDKDILLFTISCLVEAQNRGLPITRTVWLRARDLLVYCNRGTSGAEYDALAKAFERLSGTRIRTDITTGKKRTRHGFGLVDLGRSSSEPL